MIKIPKDVQQVLNILKKNGFQAYVVGGCVRDSVMGRTPLDWDVTTNAMPDEIKKAFASFKTVDTGIQHGTVLIISGETPVETTTFRIDGSYSDNRHPDSVKFTPSLKEDLARRDFTINAMAYNEEEGIIDCFGGIDDIKNKVIRCVGDPDKRFNEDALRILRAIRFSSVLGFGIEKETQESVIKNKNLLSNIAVERIDTELTKLLCGDNVFEVLTKYGSVIGVFIPDENDPILRLTMLLHDTGKPATHALNEKGESTFRNHAAVGGLIAENILRRLKFSKNYINTVSYLVSIHDKEVPETRTQVKEYLRDFGEENFLRLMKIRKADKSALAEGFRDINDKLIFAYNTFDEIINSDEPYTLNQLAVNGKDIKKYASDREIGEILSYLLDCVIKDPSKNNREDLINIARQMNNHQ